VRGASALQPILDDLPGARVRTFVVWEPVIWSDIGPPTSSVLALVRDRAAAQYWDAGLALSREIVRSINRAPREYGFDEALPESFIVWDVAAVFAPGIEWDGEFPAPTFHAGPVVYREAELARALRSALGAPDAPPPS
jgi:hypothetical protein